MPSQSQIGKALGITQQAVSKMVRAGMPVNSIASAQKWVRSKAQESKTAPAPGTLTEGRLRKVLLECELLQARIDRESDTSTLMPTSVVEQSLSFILLNLGHALTSAAGSLATELDGLDVVDRYKLLKEETHMAYLRSLSSYIGVSTIDPRIKAVAKKVMAGSYYTA